MPADLTPSFRIEQTDLPSEAVIFGDTPAMREIRGRIERALHNDLPVLIRGESGTGKEVIGRFLHVRSDRRQEPFVKLNCAAVPAGLLESELFGHEQGAFAGAKEIKRGLVEIADGGTVFLDEIGEMDWELQTKLLRLLKDGRYVRVGGREERPALVRVICSTNSDLAAAVEHQTFRQDLLFRLDVISLHLSPLRERKEDIPQICEYLLAKLAKQFGKRTPKLAPAAVQVLKQWRWPGNLRELENWIARIVIFGSEEVLGLELKRQLSSTGLTANRGHRGSSSRDGLVRRSGRQGSS